VKLLKSLTDSQRKLTGEIYRVFWVSRISRVLRGLRTEHCLVELGSGFATESEAVASFDSFFFAFAVWTLGFGLLKKLSKSALNNKIQDVHSTPKRFPDNKGSLGR